MAASIFPTVGHDGIAALVPATCAFLAATRAPTDQTRASEHSAEPFAYGAAEFIDVELYLMSRARGLPIETPGVRP